MPCSISSDQHGTSYLVPAADNVKDPRGRMLAGYPAVDVWWSRAEKSGSLTLLGKSEETIVIRQEYPDRSTADVVEITLGQAYDLIEALTKAVESK